jgi:RNA-directed DNA polymerase
MRPSHLYVRDGIRAGHNPEVLERAARVRETLEAAGAAPVLTLFDLSRQADVTYGYLRKVVERRVDEYDTILRIKKDGGTRKISSPYPLLMQAQRWILDNVLGGAPLHAQSFAYRRGLSIVDCADRHSGARWLVKLDLHNFFGQIDEVRAYRVFRGIGYPALLSFEMARVCTRVLHWPDAETQLPTRGVNAYRFPVLGVLPQGAPTSGMIANAVAARLDERLSAVAASSGFQYTRYSDDLTFSSAAEFSRANAAVLIKVANSVILKSGFQPHAKKTRVVPPGARKIVLGLLITDEGPRLLPEFRRRVLNHVRGVQHWGLAAHATHRGFRSVLSFLNHVDGCLAFAHDVDHEWTSRATQKWLAALERDGYLPAGSQDRPSPD